jgi:hypothetical protein
MKTQSTSACFFVSKNMFVILMDAVHAYSCQSTKQQTIRSVLDYATDRLENWEFDNKEISDFSKSTAVKGDIKLHLKLTTETNTKLTAIKKRMETIFGEKISARFAVAYIVKLCNDNKMYGDNI